MDVSIIIVNWNSLAYVRACLASIYTHSSGVSLEVIVVDNASPEGGVERLQVEYPAIKLIASPANIGFARANNLGFEHSTGDYILFLNPDTDLVNPAIRIMLEQARTLPQAGAVGCKLLNSDGSIQTSCIQRFPTIVNQVLDNHYLQTRWPRWEMWGIAPLFSDDPQPAAVEMVSGACLMLSRQVFECVGRFSEEYFMYAEDVDLCYKVHRLGLVNYYVGAAQVIHHGGKSTDQQQVSQWSAIMKTRAIFQFCLKTRGLLYAEVYRCAMASVALIRLAILSALRLTRKMSSRKDTWTGASAKWVAVLKWAVGRDQVMVGRKA